MTIHIALLRAVNLAGHNPVAMADLRNLLAHLGHTEGRSLLQSGNLVFVSHARTTSGLEQGLERAAKTRLGLDTPFFVRTATEWRALVAANPFPEEARHDASHLVMMLLKDAPERSAITALQNAISGREVVRVIGREAYVVYPDGIGRSRLTNALIERKLDTRGTGRNWNTVLKLAALAGGR